MRVNLETYLLLKSGFKHSHGMSELLVIEIKIETLSNGMNELRKHLGSQTTDERIMMRLQGRKLVENGLRMTWHVETEPSANLTYSD